MIQPVLDKVASYRPQADLELIKHAWDFAYKAHDGQLRVSGEPYVSHPLAVATILADLSMDEKSISAALLHDVVEDTGTPHEKIVEEFGAEVAELVEGVTKISRIDFAASKARQAENLRRMFMAMARDLRVIIIKLSDRLHNMRTLKYLPTERRRAVAEETIQIFAPIAHRLGLWSFKWELEDLCLRYLEPAKYRRIVHLVAKSRTEREGRIKAAIEQLATRLREAGIKAEVYGRPKHFYSIYLKMKTQGVDFSQILDIEAIRVIVDEVPDCYTALGVVHSLWLPMPDMFYDYIAKPKANMYQSLHTKVLGPTGDPMEVQIRTWEMHRTAEYGIAAHWRYKEGGTGPAGPKKADDKLTWVRRLIELHSDFSDPGEWLDSAKLDIFKDQVFVFTPNGDIIDLPTGATTVDFAYRIHTEVGHSCVGAKVNGKLMSLNYVFKNGDLAEILTAKTSHGPSLDWLTFVTTSTAKSRIKAWFRHQRRDENVLHGRQMLKAECKRQSLPVAEVLTEENLRHLAEKLNFASIDDIYAAVGFGESSAESVVHRLAGKPHALPSLPPPSEPKAVQGKLELSVSTTGIKSDSSILFKLSRCCCPVPGDEIIGYVTRGRGVTIHRTDCHNIQTYRKDEPERLMSVEWSLSQHAVYPVQVEIEALDRVGLLNDITAIITTSNTNIRSATMGTKKNRLATFSFMLDISDIEHLNRLMRDISSLSDILRVYRLKSA